MCAPLPAGPRSHADPPVLAAHLEVANAPHVAPLQAHAASVAARTGQPVPLFDPTGGGIHARVLILLESPGPKAAGMNGSGFTSVHNDDHSAANLWTLLNDAGIPLATTVTWNVVPWWLPSNPDAPGSFRRPSTVERVTAAPFTAELVGLMPELEVVVTAGRIGEDGWRRARRHLQDWPGTTVSLPHPGAQAFNRPAYRASMEEGYTIVRELLNGNAGDLPIEIACWPTV